MTQRFPNSSTRLLGVFSMAVKVTRLDYPIGAKNDLPDYIKKSKFINGLEDVKNNLCFWACVAMAEGCRKDRCTASARTLFKAFYGNENVIDYAGFDYVNELEKYETSNTKYAINIVSYDEDHSIEYVKRSDFNTERKPIYLNLYSDHFSYITSLEKLAKMYVCSRCSAKFAKNVLLERHVDTCKLEQEDTFVKYPQIYEKKRNDIVELSDWFKVDCDFKFDHLITFDLESMLTKIDDQTQSKLKYVAEHVPVSVSIATNVPGFEQEYFILSIDPRCIPVRMFEYFDKISEKSAELMLNKMKPLIEQIEQHYNECEKKQWLENIERYCTCIPIVGFNSGFYDINLLSKYGFMAEILKRDSEPFVIKNGTQYKTIKTKQFIFLDQMSFCAPGTSLRKFIEAHDVGLEKGHFPYEFLNSYEKLDFLVSNLKISDFDSSLKNSKLSESEFSNLMRTCKELNLVKISDLLKWYNNLDVVPLLKACLKNKEFYYKFDLDMYKDGFTLPGLSENILFQYAQKDFKEYLNKQPESNKFYVPTNIDKKIENYKSQDLKADRSLENYIEKQEVEKLFKQQKGVCYYCWNKGTVYDWSLDRIDCSKAHISGNCIIACVNCNKQRKDTFMPLFYRRKALLRFAKNNPMIYLIDENNKEVFYKIKNNIVGGPSIVYHRYHEASQTKINRVHYNQEAKQWYYNDDGKRVQQIVGYDANSLYLHCLEQDQLCGKLEWIPLESETKVSIELQKKMRNLTTQTQWIQFLSKFFGLLEVDLQVPEDKYEYFGEMPPIFKNIEYNEEEGGAYMREVIKNIHQKNGVNEKLSTARKLIASLKASRILIKSTQLKWLIEKGVQVTNLYGVIPAQRSRPFKDFVSWVSDERRKGDIDITYAIIGEAAKLVGNSAYGRTGMNKNNFQKVRFCNEKQFNRAKNNYFFNDAEEYDGVYEVASRPRTVKQNMPIQIAFNVLNDAKLRMLEFYYDCIDKYIDRSDYQYMYMDTDSAYMALAGNDIKKLIKPKLREEFEKDKNNWFPRTDTNEHKAYDKRKPGLFKLEWSGTGMIALSSKTYYCWGSEDKISCKGTQKNNNKHSLNKESYKKCLYDGTTINCKNKGFRFVDKAIKTYEQSKTGITPIYVKGIVMTDGVHVRPLDL